MSESEEENIAASLLEVAGEIGVPDPVQKGFLKAANRLIGAAIDIPAAWLEGFASDHRASADARRELQMAAAKKISADFGGSSDLANRAFAQQASRILRTQVNLEDVVARTAEELASDRQPDNPLGSPSDDWLETFRAEAELRSEEDIQSAFSRILAGEIRRPGTFSIRTVRAIGQMDQQTARVFQNYANVCVSVAGGFDVRVPSLGGNANQNRLGVFGLSFGDLNTLQENGLVQTDYHSWMEYSQFARNRVPLEYAGNRLILSLSNPNTSSVRVNGPALTTVGRELLKITDPSENEKYTIELKSFLESAGLKLE
ncbi:DUF2806 domain-containing protein [Ruegeria sp. SCSIO 43209]|uniref:DUF2806 domain-containing protein n=1 Tax=Ruegeria sp. SCSIO 43209 TaxID=2793010 RepID=UPI001CA81330|nr:DUF2806 domain-containing protein [Ruegeria sp. SCSIO 43209]UAB89918.1 DUF2806 domain-containing protein [Ruegeria sp. SCSIO 43209]